MSKLIVGIDEVGRGCWAGPLVVGAVMLGENIPEGLNDSKKLSKLQRLHVSKDVHNKALFVGLGWVWPDEVDSLGLTSATTLGIERAILKLSSYDKIIIDGKVNFLPQNPLAETLVGADSLVPAVSAASIVAKVARDSYMTKESANYPKYGFDKHVGYGTHFHRQAIAANGICSLHRKSYKPIKSILET